MSKDNVTSLDIQNKYQKLYKFLMKFLWDYQTVEALANLEIECYKSFPDKDEMQKYLEDLKYRIKNTYNELTEDDEPEFEKTFKMLEKTIDDYDPETAQVAIYNTVPVENTEEIKVNKKKEVFRFGDIEKSESEETEDESEESRLESKEKITNPFEEDEDENSEE
jgi:hypothetical protein